MNTKEAIRNAKIGLTVITGVTAIFIGAFVVATLAAFAAEDYQDSVKAPSEDQVDVPDTEPLPEAAPQAEAPGPAAAPPLRPGFRDIDRDGDGAITEEEFRAFRSMAPSARFADAPRSRDDRGNRRPRREARAPREERYDNRDFERGPRDDRYDARGDDFGPPPRPRGGQYDDRFDSGDRYSQRPPFPHGGRNRDWGPGQFVGRGEGPCDRNSDGDERSFGPPPGRRGDEFGRDDYRRPPRRPDF